MTEIKSLRDLAEHLGKPIKYHTGDDPTWRFARLRKDGTTLQDPEQPHLRADAEVYGGTHSTVRFTTTAFHRGWVVKLPSLAEVQGKRWSYAFGNPDRDL